MVFRLPAPKVPGSSPHVRSLPPSILWAAGLGGHGKSLWIVCQIRKKRDYNMLKVACGQDATCWAHRFDGDVDELCSERGPRKSCADSGWWSMKPSPFGLTRLSPKQIHYCACGKATKTNEPIKVKYGSTPPCLTQALQCLNLLVWENFSKAMRANSMTVGWASELWETKRTNKDKDKNISISELKVTLRCGASPKTCLKWKWRLPCHAAQWNRHDGSGARLQACCQARSHSAGLKTSQCRLAFIIRPQPN